MIMTSFNLPFWMVVIHIRSRGDCVSLYRTKEVKAFLSVCACSDTDSPA